MKTKKQPESLGAILTEGTQASKLLSLREKLERRLAVTQNYVAMHIGDNVVLGTPELRPETFPMTKATNGDSSRGFSSKKVRLSHKFDIVGDGIEVGYFYLPFNVASMKDISGIPEASSVPDIYALAEKDNPALCHRLKAILRYLNVIQRKALELDIPVLISAQCKSQHTRVLGTSLLTSHATLLLQFQILSESGLAMAKTIAREPFGLDEASNILFESACLSHLLNASVAINIVSSIGTNPHNTRDRIAEAVNASGTGAVARYEQSNPGKSVSLQYALVDIKRGTRTPESEKNLAEAMTFTRNQIPVISMAYSLEFNRVIRNISRLSLHEPDEDSFINV